MTDPTDVVPAGDLEMLRARLAERAAADGALDVAYRTLDTDIGTLLLAATTVGLVSVTFDGADPDATLGKLAAVLSPRVLESRARLDTAARGVEALVSGAAESFDAPLDLSLASGFRRDVVAALQHIPYGQTRSYADIARDVGSPLAVRAVGSACKHNPLPIVIPCHRVVRSDGSIGQYAGGVAAKQQLLRVEAVHDR